MSDYKIGACVYCGQQMQIYKEFDKEPNKGDLAHEATMLCGCDDAQTYRRIEAKKNKAMENAENITNNEDIQDILKFAINSLLMSHIDKLTIEAEGIIYKAFIDSKNFIHIYRKESIEKDLTE